MSKLAMLAPDKSFDPMQSRRLVAVLSSVVALSLTLGPALAASTSAPVQSSTKPSSSSTAKNKPVLKAIDPAQAKMDSVPGSVPSPSPNPLGGITGAPVSGDNARSVLPQQPPSWPTYPPGQGYPAPTYVQQPQRPAYQPQYQQQPYQQQPYQQQPYQQPYQAQNYQPPVYQPPAYPPPQQTYQQPYQQPQYQYAQPPAPAQYAQPQPGYGAYGQPSPYQGQPGYGGQQPQQVVSPPGYPSMPAQQPQQIVSPPGYPSMPAQQPQQIVSPPGYPSMPPQGFNNAGPKQPYVQQSQGQDYPAGRARLGGGHPNLVPQGPPPGYPSYPNAYPAQNQYPQQQQYPQNSYNPGYNQAAPQQGFRSQQGFQGATQSNAGNFPPASLIPEFGKPLPIDASTRGPAQGWSTNQPVGGTAISAPNTSQDPNEMRVTRLEKVAFGSTYPEHEVADRVDHLEKEIFGKTSEGDLNSRIARLEAKLGGGGNFSSSMRNQSTTPQKNDNPASEGTSSNQMASMSSSAPGNSKVTTDGAMSSAFRTGTSKPSIPYSKGDGDYFEQVTHFVNNTAARWTHFPVRVRLPDDATDGWKKLMEPGIERWGRFIPMKTAGAEESADIEVSFVNHLVPRVLGVTRLTVTGGKMKVFVYMLRPSYYQNALNEKNLTVAFTHELGHAIGIFGHSDQQTDAMYRCEVAPGGKGKLTLERLGTISTRDVNTLKLIYDSEPLPQDFTLSAPQEWSLLEGAS